MNDEQTVSPCKTATLAERVTVSRLKIIFSCGDLDIKDQNCRITVLSKKVITN
jgi:hypothetical protein